MSNLSIHQRQVQIMRAFREVNATRQQVEETERARIDPEESAATDTKESQLKMLEIDLQKGIAAYRWTQARLEGAGLKSLIPKTFDDVPQKYLAATTASADDPESRFEQVIVEMTVINGKSLRTKKDMENARADLEKWQRRRTTMRMAAIAVAIIVILLLLFFLTSGS